MTGIFVVALIVGAAFAGAYLGPGIATFVVAMTLGLVAQYLIGKTAAE